MSSSYYSFDPDDIWSALAVSTGVFAILAVILIIVLIIAAAFYVLKSIGLYKMAKKVGYSKAWLAWIPYASTWLMFNLPTKEYRVLALNKVIPSRNVAFWIWLAISVGGSYAVSILGVIPYLGVILLPLGELAVLAATIFMIYPMYRDLFLLYYTESSAQGYAIASTICNYIAPIVPPILMLITASKAPREIQVDAYTVE
jgi:hypothetical protein